MSGNKFGGPQPNAGRPCEFNEEVAAFIVERVENGDSLINICSKPPMPNYTTVTRWQRKFPAFAASIYHARKASMFFHEENVMDRARDAANRDDAACAKVYADVFKSIGQLRDPDRFRTPVVGGPDAPAGPANVLTIRIIGGLPQEESAPPAEQDDTLPVSETIIPDTLLE